MFRATTLVCLLITAFSATGVSAQPSPAIKFFMTQPLSVFDFGMYRLKEDLDDWVTYQRFNLPGNSRFDYQVYYHRESHKIRLDFDVRVPSNYLYEITVKEKACSRVVTSLRRYFFTVGISKGVEPIPDQERSMKGIYRYFQYKGASETGRPDDAMYEIENATVIRVTLIPGRKIEEAFRCTARLMGEEIEYLAAPGAFTD